IVDSVRGITRFTYDGRDRLLSRTDPDGLAVAYTYDANGNRTSVSGPSGTANYTFDALDRIETVTSSAHEATIYSYDAVGNRQSVALPNGLTETYAYDSANRLVNIFTTNAVGVIASYSYTLGPAGNRTQVHDSSGRLVGYGYDKDYRLT